MNQDKDSLVNILKNIEKQQLDFYNDLSYCSYYKDFYKDLIYPVFFSKIHWLIVNGFKDIQNAKVRDDGTRYIHAQESRFLKHSILAIKQARQVFKDTEYDFVVNEEILNILVVLDNQLKETNGSFIKESEEFANINIPYAINIFSQCNTVKVWHSETAFKTMTFLGKGSYGNVYKYDDDFLNCSFALKVFKKENDSKSLDRFKEEFKICKSLDSPYIIHVYRYLDQENAIIMELMDGSIEKICQTNIEFNQRASIAKQVFKSVIYLHSKRIKHRDICAANFLYKKFDDGTIIVKMADLGIAKDLENRVTSTNSEIKGHYCDYEVYSIGFANYDYVHDLWPLSLLISFIMTGKMSINNQYSTLKKFEDKARRHEFQTCIDEYKYFESILPELKREIAQNDKVQK